MATLINTPRPLRYLFLDLNSYFASVEQQERPELRGKPVAVVPVMADSSCCIAASYEAKAYGVRTGTRIDEAKRLCPDLILVSGAHKIYTHYHNKILACLENVLPVEKVCSIDEMLFRLLGDEREPENARKIALKMKQRLHDEVGEAIRCSIGIGTNPFLAKIGTELQKPDGLVILEAHDLPDKLHSLKLTEFTGINRRMAARLNGASIFSAQQLCAASREELLLAFGSVIGERWWYWLRGYDLPSPATHTRSLGHSHVLPPEFRTEEGARKVLLRLLQKATARLRASGFWPGEMWVSVRGRRQSWAAGLRFPNTQDSVEINEHFEQLWADRTFEQPVKTSVTFYHLKTADQVTPSLFDASPARVFLNHAVDKVNQKFGKNTVYLAAVHEAKDTAPERIAFTKTWLFSEGKGDHEWTQIDETKASSDI